MSKSAYSPGWKKNVMSFIVLLAIPSAPPDTAQFQQRQYGSPRAVKMFEMLAEQFDGEPTISFLLQGGVSALCVFVHLVQ